MQEFWFTFIDTDVVKGAVDFLTTLVSLATELVDTLGSIPTVIGLITGGLAIKNNISGKGGGRAKLYLLY